jgi:CDP-2,3-bis-(O-geranylgeranyl)-sn-glycerol synthase
LTDVLHLIGSALWFILPAYVANAAPVVLGGGRPIDGGKKLADGRRILGAGKTWRGLAAGLVAGTVIGLAQGLIDGGLPHYLLLGLLLAVGALLGDLLGSFIKRRAGIARGGAAPGLDQLSFLLVALLVASPITVPGWQIILILVLITPPIHLGTNFAGYLLGLKNRPY